ncbi:hypothetical protein [Actinotalea sp. C106]|uniref:hypothetical protein n=1 Tax=Actinotalea sp. C106 TaxID=2908644 RepID=UPI002027A36F|nr:hypothetical protein [Actinotalea sp. C106]
MSTVRTEPVLVTLAALGETRSPVRWPALFATTDRLFRTGPDDAATGHVVRWLLQHDHATVRAGGLHLRPQVEAVARRARVALDSGDSVTRATLLHELGLDGVATSGAGDDVAARLLLVPPVPTTWPRDPTRGWPLASAAVLAAASWTGSVTSTRVRQLWFEAQSRKLDQAALTDAVLMLTAARLVVLRNRGGLRLTRAGRRARSSARRRSSWSDGRWAGDQPLWAALAALADGAAAGARPDHAPPGLTVWLDSRTASGGRRTRC